MANTATKKHEALTARDEAVTRWETADAALAKAQEAEQAAPKPSAARATARAKRLSAGARKANARRDIAQAQLDLRMDGVEHTEWIEPPARRASGKSRLLDGPEYTQAAIQAKIDKVRAYDATLTDDQASVKHDCSVRIKALQRAGEARGYSLS